MDAPRPQEPGSDHALEDGAAVDHPAANDANASNASFTAYATGVGSWFGAWGLQQVLFSWIVVGELRASSEWVGIAQTSTMLPALLLLMAGGVVADRLDPRRMLILLHGLAALPVLALSLTIAYGRASLPTIIAYGLSIGIIQAFVMPARDTLLTHVAGPNMMRAVSTMTAVQFGSQALGNLVAGAARWTGSATMLVLQALLLLIGSFASRGVPSVPPRLRAKHEATGLREIGAGLAYVIRTPNLRAPAILVVAVGICFIGPFVVVFPLLVRDYYGAGVDTLALVLMLFPVGTIAGSLVLRGRGIGRKGAAALIALMVGASVEAIVGLGIPFWGMLTMTFIWGLAASVFITSSRTLYQEAAPTEERGRVLAIYQLGFMGGAPVGSLLSGYSSSIFGLHTTLLIAGGCMMMLASSMALFSDTRHMT